MQRLRFCFSYKKFCAFVLLGIVVGLQSVGLTDRLQADHTRYDHTRTERSSKSARAAGPVTLGDTLDRTWRDRAFVAVAIAQTKSRLTVIVPEDDTELFIDDKAINTIGKSSEFDTPPIEAGKTYEYKFTATWRPNNYTVITRKKTVQFTAGNEVTVDLTTDDPSDRAQVRYVPTPNTVVQQMIALAEVNKDDVIYEPGCGDARITIAAVEAGAKRGVGIDIDPERVADSTANVRAAKLDDRIDIRLGDALDVKDLGDATVVFLYMGDEFDMLIRPILWKQLKVGTRIVSHRFTMGDWAPDKTVEVSLPDGGDPYELHLWTITEAIKARAEAH